MFLGAVTTRITCPGLILYYLLALRALHPKELHTKKPAKIRVFFRPCKFFFDFRYFSAKNKVRDEDTPGRGAGAGRKKTASAVG